MKRVIAALSAAALLLAGTPTWADDDDRRGRRHDRDRGWHDDARNDRHGGKHRARERHDGYRDGGHRHKKSRDHGRDDYGPLVVGALVGGLVLGHVLTQSAKGAPASYAPPRQPALGNCQATTGTSYHYGRPALYGGTVCFDRYGRGYIQPGSEHFIGYLN